MNCFAEQYKRRCPPAITDLYLYKPRIEYKLESSLQVSKTQYYRNDLHVNGNAAFSLSQESYLRIVISLKYSRFSLKRWDSMLFLSQWSELGFVAPEKVSIMLRI